MSGLKCKVSFLDGSEAEFEVAKKAKGSALMENVYRHLNLVEQDYFGLILRGAELQNVWLDPDKKIKKQMNKSGKLEFEFVVKYYPSDTKTLKEEITRYQMCLQIRKDLATNLTCSLEKLAILLSYWLQSEYEGKSDNAQTVKDCLKDFENPPTEASTKDFTDKVLSLYRKRRDMSSADVDVEFLSTATGLPMYGIHFFEGKDTAGAKIRVGIGAKGVIEKREGQAPVSHTWNRIKNVVYKDNRFKIKLLRAPSNGDPRLKKSFIFDSEKQVHLIWKTAVDHHVFFRIGAKEKKPLPAASSGKKSKKRKSLFRRLSSRKKKPKTETEVQETRSSTLRRSLSLQSTSQSSMSPGHPAEASYNISQENPEDSVQVEDVPDSRKDPKSPRETAGNSDKREYNNEDLMEAVIGKMDSNASGESSTLLLTETILEEDEDQDPHPNLPSLRKRQRPVHYARLRSDDEAHAYAPPQHENRQQQEQPESHRTSRSLMETDLDAEVILSPKPDVGTEKFKFAISPLQQTEEHHHERRTVIMEDTEIKEQYTEVWEEIEVLPPSPHHQIREAQIEEAEYKHDEHREVETGPNDDVDRDMSSSSSQAGEVHFNTQEEIQIPVLSEEHTVTEAEEAPLPVFDDLHKQYTTSKALTGDAQLSQTNRLVRQVSQTQYSEFRKSGQMENKEQLQTEDDEKLGSNYDVNVFNPIPVTKFTDQEEEQSNLEEQNDDESHDFHNDEYQETGDKYDNILGTSDYTISSEKLKSDYDVNVFNSMPVPESPGVEDEQSNMKAQSADESHSDEYQETDDKYENILGISEYTRSYYHGETPNVVLKADDCHEISIEQDSIPQETSEFNEKFKKSTIDYGYDEEAAKQEKEQFSSIREYVAKRKTESSEDETEEENSDKGNDQFRLLVDAQVRDNLEVDVEFYQVSQTTSYEHLVNVASDEEFIPTDSDHTDKEEYDRVQFDEFREISEAKEFVSCGMTDDKDDDEMKIEIPSLDLTSPASTIERITDDQLAHEDKESEIILSHRKVDEQSVDDDEKESPRKKCYVNREYAHEDSRKPDLSFSGQVETQYAYSAHENSREPDLTFSRKVEEQYEYSAHKDSRKPGLTFSREVETQYEYSDHEDSRKSEFVSCGMTDDKDDDEMMVEIPSLNFTSPVSTLGRITDDRLAREDRESEIIVSPRKVNERNVDDYESESSRRESDVNKEYAHKDFRKPDLSFSGEVETQCEYSAHEDFRKSELSFSRKIENDESEIILSPAHGIERDMLSDESYKVGPLGMETSYKGVSGDRMTYGAASTTAATIGDDDDLALEELDDEILYEEEHPDSQEEGKEVSSILDNERISDKDKFELSPQDSTSRSTSLSDITDNTDELLQPDILEKTWSHGAGLDEGSELFQVLFRTPPLKRRKRRNRSEINPHEVRKGKHEAIAFKTTLDDIPISPRRRQNLSRRPFIPSWPFDPASLLDSRDLEDLDREAIKAAMEAQNELIDEDRRIEEMEIMDDIEFLDQEIISDMYPPVSKNLTRSLDGSESKSRENSPTSTIGLRCVTRDDSPKAKLRSRSNSPPTPKPRRVDVGNTPVCQEIIVSPRSEESKLVKKVRIRSRSPSASPRMVGEEFIPGVPDFVHSVVPYQLKSPEASEDSSHESSGTVTQIPQPTEEEIDPESMKFPKSILKFAGPQEKQKCLKYRYSPPGGVKPLPDSESQTTTEPSGESGTEEMESIVFSSPAVPDNTQAPIVTQPVMSSGRSTPQSGTGGNSSQSEAPSSKSSSSSFPRFIHSVFPLRRSSSNAKPRGRSKTRRKNEKKVTKQKNKKKPRSKSKDKKSNQTHVLPTIEVTSPSTPLGFGEFTGLPSPPHYAALSNTLSPQSAQVNPNGAHPPEYDQESLDKIVLSESDDAHSDSDAPITVRKADV